MRGTSGLSLLPALLLAACAGCSSEPRGPRPNVVLLTVDTLRWDHVGLYGYPRDTTPQLDRFFSARTVFDNAASPAPCTLPAVPQVLAGSFLVGGGHASLAEILRERGYATAAIASQHQFHGSSPWVAAVRAGFATFDVQGRGEVDRHDNSTRTAVEVSDRALRWLAGASDREPFLLWLHYFDPHDPYTPPAEHDVFHEPGLSARSGDRRHALKTERRSPAEPWQRAGYVFDEGDVRHLVNLYDGEIRYVDAQIGRVLAALERGGLVERSIVVFTSDHGEWLGEDDRWDHCQTLQEPEIRVPLMFAERGRRLGGEARTDRAVSTLDVVPTILGRLGIDPGPWAFDGADLASAPEERPVFGSWIRWSAARQGRWKLLHRDRPVALYDVVGDPYETDNRIADEPDVLARLTPELDAFLRRVPPVDAQNRAVLERLRALGYID